MNSKILLFILSIAYCCISNSIQASLKALVNNIRQKPSAASLTLTEWPSYNLFEPNGPGTYAFGYEIDDVETQNIQFRDEEKLQNGTVRGSYGTVRPNGLVSLTQYVADHNGYRADTQTFGNTNGNPILLTSTQSPISVPPSPNDIDYLDITISPEIGQQIIDNDKEINFKPNTSLDTTSHKPSNTQMTVNNSKPQTSIDRQDNAYEVYEDDNDDDENNDTYTEDTLSSNQIPEYGNINTAINQQYPIKFITKDNQTFGIQLVNNFIPHNFQIIPFSLPKQTMKKKKKPTITEANRPEIAHDEIFEEQQVNDKFFDPIYDGDLLRKIINTNNGKLIKKKSILNRRNKFNYNIYRMEHENLLKKYGLI